MNAIRTTSATVVIVWSIIYAIAYMTASAIDRGHCMAYGAAYHSTSITLVGWCTVSGVKVRAEGLGQ